MPGQIAAVDRRHILRLQDGQIRCAVPVVQMPAVFRQRLQRGQGRGDPVRGGALADPAEIAGRGNRQQVKPDVGGRGPLGNLTHRAVLKIVGRQVVRGLRHEVFEKPPGHPGRAAQGGGVGGADYQMIQAFLGPPD